MINCLFVGDVGGGGEEVFVRDLAERPPPGVRYTLVQGYHDSARGARAQWLREVAFNRLVHPLLWPLKGLRAYSIDESFDLVHVHNFAHRVQSKRPVPVVMTLGGGGYYHYVRDYLGWTEERIDALYRRARRILRPLGITNEMANWEGLAGIAVFSRFAQSFFVRAGVPEELVTIIPPGFETPPDLRTPPSTDRPGRSGPFTFLFVGRDPARKGADVAIEAFRELRAEGLDVRFVMVGDPSFESLREEDGFEVHPWIERATLYEKIFPSADVLIHPARSEGYGFVPVEALSFGLPVVASRVDALPEIVTDGVDGLLVEPGERRPLVEAMRTLATDLDRTRSMGEAARRTFEAEFTRERFLGRMAEFYQGALDRAGRR